MAIAVLGWGSLIWNPAELPLSSGWFHDGPSVPVEFARQSQDGRLTLVIHGEHHLPVYWATLDVTDLETARRVLGWREGIIGRNNMKLSRHVGWWNQYDRSTDNKYPNGHKVDLELWARRKNLDGVVWTALPPKWGEERGLAPKITEATEYLAGLSGDRKALAFDYIRNAPVSIRTPFRDHFEANFPEIVPVES